MKKLKYIPLVLITTSLILNAANANVPKIGDAMRQAQHPKELTEPKSKTLIKVKGIQPVYKPKLQDDKSAKKVIIKSFKIEGNAHINSKLLLSLLNAYKNKKLSFEDMQVAASIVTKEYRKKGYIVARAYIPVQSISDDVLEISVIEGVYGKFQLKNNSRFSTSLLQKIFDTNKQGEVITSDSLERVLLTANNMPGVVVSSANIKAGDSVGSSDFLITIDASKAYNGYVLVNNYGGRYTGENQLLAGANILNPFGIGDKLSLTGLISNGQGLSNGSVSYSILLNQYGLRGEIGYNATSYTLSKEFANLNAVGHSQGYYFKLNYPLLKRRAENLNLFVRLEKNYLTDEIRTANTTTDKTLYAYRVGLDYTKTDLALLSLNQTLQTSLIFTQGDLKFEDETQSALDRAGANTQGSFSKIQLSVDYNLDLGYDISLENTFSYQHSLGNKNLDGSEDFSVGGAYGVKLYPSGELSAENGYIYKIEAKYSITNPENFISKLGLFYDLGKASMQNPSVTFVSHALEDMGIGYYANYKQLFANIEVAWKINSQNITSEPDQNYKVLVMGGVRF